MTIWIRYPQGLPVMRTPMEQFQPNKRVPFQLPRPLTPALNHLTNEQYGRLETLFGATEELNVMDSRPGGCRYFVDSLNWADFFELGKYLPIYKPAFSNFSKTG